MSGFGADVAAMRAKSKVPLVAKPSRCDNDPKSATREARLTAQDPGSTDKDLRIRDVRAFATSYPIPPGQSVTLGVGRAVKRDAVVVKVTTEGGLAGYGESHHGRAHTSIAQLVNTTLRTLVLGMSAADVVGVWNRIYSKQLASHGMGAGCAMAM